MSGTFPFEKPCVHKPSCILHSDMNNLHVELSMPIMQLQPKPSWTQITTKKIKGQQHKQKSTQSQFEEFIKPSHGLITFNLNKFSINLPLATI